MKLIIDTNVLVSAVLKDRDPEEVILYAASQPDSEWIVSPEILAEYKDVLKRAKFRFPEDILQSWFTILDSLTTVVDADVAVDFPRDRKDAKFIACALVSEADFFITGDRDFDQPLKILHTTVLSVRQFKKLIMNR
jgi:putative PIN family toxin of toxin-antitoxin system